MGAQTNVFIYSFVGTALLQKNIRGKELRRENIRSQLGSSNSDLGGLLLWLPTVVDGNGCVSERFHLEPGREGSLAELCSTILT